MNDTRKSAERTTASDTTYEGFTAGERTYYALMELTAYDEARIAALVKRAVS
jgi:hypothetical protein